MRFEYSEQILKKFPRLREEMSVSDVRIGLAVPKRLEKTLQGAWERIPQYIQKVIPANEWQVELWEFSDVQNANQYADRICRDMSQKFVPTVRVLHVGRGENRNELWAYVEASERLKALREEIRQRLISMRFPVKQETTLRGFRPHIKVAKLFPMARSIGMSDFPAVSSFTVQELNLRINNDKKGVINLK